MKIEHFVSVMEQIAPSSLALGYDNPGMLIEPDSVDIHKVLVALDCTIAVAKEAVALGCDLVLTHHPLFFHGVKHIAKSDPETAAAYILLRHGIGLFAAHTNLDAAKEGVNDVLCSLLDMTGISIVGEDAIMRIGDVKPHSLQTLCSTLEEKLSCAALATGEPAKVIAKAAVVGGSGGDLWKLAQENGADVLITGECKYHEALDAQAAGMCVVTCGHYETERPVLESLISRLQKMSNDVQYKLALAGTSPQRRI